MNTINTIHFKITGKGRNKITVFQGSFENDVKRPIMISLFKKDIETIWPVDNYKIELWREETVKIPMTW